MKFGAGILRFLSLGLILNLDQTGRLCLLRQGGDNKGSFFPLKGDCWELLEGRVCVCVCVLGGSKCPLHLPPPDPPPSVCPRFPITRGLRGV